MRSWGVRGARCPPQLTYMPQWQDNRMQVALCQQAPDPCRDLMSEVRCQGAQPLAALHPP